MKVSLFITCLGDIFYVNAGKAAVELLERLGCEVDFPASQTCCGQPAYNSGYHTQTKRSAKNMIEAFENADYVVGLSGSCAYMVHEYPHLFENEPEWKQKAEILKKKTFEFTQFITDVLKISDVEATFKAKATYHTSCHMTRLLGVKDSPYTLLKNVKGLELFDLPHKEDCCGFGGTFSVKMNRISEQMVDEKVMHIESTDADVLIGADAGCLMNIGGRIERQDKPIQVFHIAEILNSRGEV
ncbi:(Fe-S)-binding protein [Saliterribacillus persicus]|uniref:Lactate utilization protein A n=1 Tax=Saliterribacillus persicus TaxID=930114 RepID=A0A368XBE3_9BACI|nr:(Fe-S)-binding protein [Saliterribacillus persicus]RCW63747.1 L-lactate dehydrogenase complex protein LldE [Saliterribacillus persicus]